MEQKSFVPHYEKTFFSHTQRLHQVKWHQGCKITLNCCIIHPDPYVREVGFNTLLSGKWHTVANQMYMCTSVTCGAKVRQKFATIWNSSKLNSIWCAFGVLHRTLRYDTTVLCISTHKSIASSSMLNRTNFLESEYRTAACMFELVGISWLLEDFKYEISLTVK